MRTQSGMPTLPHRARILSLAAAGMFCLTPSIQAQVPKQGTINGRFGWSGSGTQTELEPNHVFFVGGFSGTYFSDERGGFLDVSSWQCPGFNDIVNGVTKEGHGYCTATDQAGDKVFWSWKSKGSAPSKGNGDFTLTGGTGKYKGITGGGTFDYLFVGNTGQGVSTSKGEYRIP